MDVFFVEVGGLLADLGEGGDGEGLIGGDGFAGEGALPAVVEDPAVDVGVPVGGGGEDAAGEGEGVGLELEDGEVGEDVFVGVEELVVEDARGCGWVFRQIAFIGGLCGVLFGGLAGDPLAVGTEEGLGGLAFDDGAQGLLAAIGGGKIELVEGEEGGGDEERGAEDRRDDAVEADAGGLHGGELGGC